MNKREIDSAVSAGLTQDSLKLFLLESEELLGVDQVIAQKEKMVELSRDPVFTSVPPAAFIYPQSTGEVVLLVRLAAKYSVSLWPYSTGKNWGYCNTTGSPNSVVVILNKMDKIIHVDPELAYAEIEPGVTYEQLNAYLKIHNIPLWTDCTGGPPSGSVIGNALDRGVGVTPSGDHFSNLCGMEVVLPNGKVIRTGGFGEDKKGAWHTYKWGIGPSLEGLFAQSNYGIVTKAGIWLMKAPEDFVVGSLKLESKAGLAPALDAFRELMFRGIIPEKARFSNDVAIATLLTQAINEKLEGKNSLTANDLASLRRKYGIPAWTGSFGIYGIKPFVRLMRKESHKKLKPLGKILFVTEKTAALAKAFSRWVASAGRRVKNVTNIFLKAFFGTTLPFLRLIPELLDIHKGIPNESVVRRAYFRHASPRPEKEIHVAKDQVGLLWFVPLLPAKGQEVSDYVDDCGKMFRDQEFDFYVTIMMMNARTVVPLMVILYQLNDKKSCARAKALYDALYQNALSRGYQQFRCAELGWDKIFSETPELKEVYEMIKNTLDPSHILAPRRYGIGRS